MKITAVVEALVASGASPDTILAAVRAIETQQVDALEKRREADRNRQAKRRSVTLGHVTSERSRSRARAVEISSNSEIKDLGKEDKKAPATPTPRDELAAVLDADHVEAVIDHRKGFRGKFNTRAAHLLAIEFAKCPDPNAAADEMIRRNWQGFKADWMDDKRSRDPPGSRHGQPTAWQRQAQAFEDIRNELQQQRPDQSLAGPVLSLPRTGTDGQ